MNSKFAFTLAETLITLVIVGVVAALTVPAIIVNSREQQIVSSVKSVYSQLAQAIQKTQVANGPIKTWDSYAAIDLIKQNLIITKDCGKGTGCFPDVMYKNLNGSNYSKIDSYSGQTIMSKFILNNGVSVFMYRNVAENGNILVWFDVNGFKGPNQWGKDIFMLVINFSDGSIILPPETNGRCVKSGNGWSCSRWIIEHENMDYPKS